MDPRPRTALLAVGPADSADSVMTWSRSGSDEGADQFDHAVDVSIGEIGEQRQRYLLLVVVVRDEARTALVAQISIDGVPVSREVIEPNRHVGWPKVAQQAKTADVADDVSAMVHQLQS